MVHTVLALRKLLATAGHGMKTYIQTFFSLSCLSFTDLCYGYRLERSEKKEVVWNLMQS